MKLTSLGRKLVAPEKEGEDIAARREAILRPRILREFFERYRRAKLPSDVIAGNVLKTLSLPAERVRTAFEIIRENGRYAGIIRDAPTGPFVNLDSPVVPAPTATSELPEQDAMDSQVEVEESGNSTFSTKATSPQATLTSRNASTFDTTLNRVYYISW
jgi:hypothetical protein